ncbi:hypothetical protein PsYK624_101330 [Phanerochaete sordida]|uniref:Uncharacterized protein n=1 Tax=Phanerochaete sordida TaxID=48140 RepID=A0A9P3GFH2_9APHY|nr:hypothetical protein PsYK624_101330 [Phanerochaete sordida]
MFHATSIYRIHSVQCSEIYAHLRLHRGLRGGEGSAQRQLGNMSSERGPYYNKDLRRNLHPQKRKQLSGIYPVIAPGYRGKPRWLWLNTHVDSSHIALCRFSLEG